MRSHTEAIPSLPGLALHEHCCAVVSEITTIFKALGHLLLEKGFHRHGLDGNKFATPRRDRQQIEVGERNPCIVEDTEQSLCVNRSKRETDGPPPKN